MWWRFLLPALAMTAALIVLFAGVLGDLKSLPDLSARAIAMIGGTEARHAPLLATPAPAAATALAVAEQQAARDALQRQIADLQRQAGDLEHQIAQRSHDIEAKRAEMDGLRQGLEAMRAETETLRQQRQAEEDALARNKAQVKQMATANASRRPPAPRPASPPPPFAPALTQSLQNAQQWLAAGRPDEARNILATAQTQMVLRPVTPDHPMAEGGNPSATEIGTAIRWLDMGANSQAMQAISRAIIQANAAEPRPRPWSDYPNQPLGGPYAN
jgi:regulator of replication initiation timing